MQSVQAKKGNTNAPNATTNHNNGAKGISMPAIPVLQQKEQNDALQLQAATIQRHDTIQQQSVIQNRFVAQSHQTGTADQITQLKRFEPNTAPVQKKANNTGLPDNLKSGIENLSGFSMDDTRVHYNSAQPAQLNAHAYAQGSDIHIAPGQEKHLPHETWHVVQQKQGRVQATMQMKGNVPVNDDKGLENEADVMGNQAAAFQFIDHRSLDNDVNKQQYGFTPIKNTVIQQYSHNPIQLLQVGGNEITKTGKTGKWLLGELKSYLLNNGYSPHGLSKYFKEELVGINQSFTLEDFLKSFGEDAKKEVERVNEIKKKRKKDDPRIKSWTRELKLNRPAWTPEHKELTESGQDIRHIVRNATMKNAIYGEYQHQLTNGTSAIFKNIAAVLGLETGDHPWEAMKNVYNAAFLNKDNLFGGGGGVNRVIGLTADPLIALGNKILGTKDPISEERVTLIYKEADDLIQAQIYSTWEQGKKLKKGIETFQGGMEDFYEIITDFLDDAHGQWLDAASEGDDTLNIIIGKEILDIGLNFGFDIPTDSSDPLVTARLLKVEELLGNHTPGNPKQLAETLYLFIKGKEVGIDLKTGEIADHEALTKTFTVGKSVRVNQTGEEGTISGRYSSTTGLCKVQFYDKSGGIFRLLAIKEFKPGDITII
jgi:hypothetical protein